METVTTLYEMYPSVDYGQNFFYLRKVPDICRDGVKQVVRKEPEKPPRKKGFRVYHQLWGGLRHPLSRSKEDIFLEDSDDEKDERCTSLEHSSAFRNKYLLTTKRKHVRVKERERVDFIPLTSNIYHVPSRFGCYTIAEHANLVRPDQAFIYNLEMEITKLYRTSRYSRVEFHSITYNVGMMNMRFLSVNARDSLIRTIANLIEKQKELKWVSFENLLLFMTEGLRILLTVAIGAGETVEVLNIWNLFAPGLFPILTEEDVFDEYNEFDEEMENESIKPDVLEAEKFKIWNKFMTRPSFLTFNPQEQDRYFKLALHSLSNLSRLSINYSCLSKGQGASLLQLESIRNGSLQHLFLLCTQHDHPNKTKQRISELAWKHARRLCPLLKVHFVLVCLPAYNDVIKILPRTVPLEGFEIIDSLPLTEFAKTKNWWFDCITRTLIHHFFDSLRSVCFQLWHPRQRMDFSLTRLLIKLPHLERFEYRGAFDKYDTLHEICNFAYNNKTKLKSLKLFVQDDPCHPEKWVEAVDEINKKFKLKLQVVGVDLTLEISKI